MPTKTDRILSYLPPTTFLTSARPPAVLYTLVDAFGNELLLGENSLAEIMLAHWVDFADKNQPVINDLAKMAALYGLVPFADESGDTLETVEEFREHLKRYVRTFLEGTVTVQGILRVTAESLGLRIADAPEQLDRWWARKNDAVITVEAQRNDARNLLNFDRSSASGSPALPARIVGTADLSQPVDLEDANFLRLMIDGVFEEIDLTEGLAPGTKLSVDQIVTVINKSTHPPIASRNGNSLTLTSTRLGSSSSLELVNGVNDAAPALLGLPPRTYHGDAATGAQFRGTVDLSTKVDLSNERYLRIEVDREFREEIDCAGTNASQTTLAEIRSKINNAFPGLNVASDDGKHLILTSPGKGFDSSISVQAPAAQNACEKIFGVSTVFVSGKDAQPARVVSTRDLRGRVDLSKRSKLQLRIDGGNALTIDCAGIEPAKTERVEIVAAINAAAGATVGVITEKSISLVSPTTGLTSEIVFEEPPDDDATFDLFGIGPQSFLGSAAATARLIASPALKDNGIDVRANNFLLLSVDGATPVEIDLSKATDDISERRSVSLNKVAAYINNSLGSQVASTDGTRLFLASTRTGAPGKVEVFRRELTRERRFVTRATIVDEAAREIFGFISGEAVPTAAVSARLVGTPDLSQTIDLTKTPFLRLRVDRFAPLEINASGARARATTLDEIISKINAAAKANGAAKDIANSDGKHLIVTSVSAGAESRVEIESPRGALDKVLGSEPRVFKGVDATTLKFSSIPDLTGGIDLPAGAAIKLAIDDAAAVEIKLTEAAPAKRTPVEIVSAINAAFASAAKTDGRRIEIRSAKQGIDSKIRFETPAGTDVTKQVFGIVAPREYHGAAATPARVVGLTDLSSATDLSTLRLLNIAIDGVAQTLNCASKAAKPKAVTLAEIVDSIGPDIAAASADGKHLVLRSSSTGANARLEIKPLDTGDASTTLFGTSPRTATGTAAVPAVITGEKNLVTGVNLSRRSLLRIAVDGGRPIDIDVAGTEPASTASNELVEKINAVFPNLAGITDDNNLQLTAPGDSKISLQPLRFLEVIEYPPVKSHFSFTKNHNGSWTIENDGVADGLAEIRITATKGAVGPAIVNSGVNWTVHLFIVLERGETARIFRDERLRLRAEIVGIDGRSRPIPPSQIQSGPLGSQAIVPFTESWKLTGDQNQLQLNNPNSPDIVVLKSLRQEDDIIVRVAESDINSLPPQTITADTQNGRLVGRLKIDDKSLSLVDSKGTLIANLILGPHVDPLIYRDRAVKVEGPIFTGTTGLLRVEKIAALFDVALYCELPGKPPVKEYYRGVTIGAQDDNDSLTRQLNGASKLGPASALVRADQLDKAIVLKVGTGRNLFRYLDCLGPRFDFAHFNRARFPNGNCGERGIFDVSRFSNSPPERVRAVFACAPPLSDPPVTIDFQFEKFGAAEFVVNLPADLPSRFGGRFNESKFGEAAGDDKRSAQVFQNAVAEPESDPNFLVKLINSPANGSKFVTAERVSNMGLGYVAAEMNHPFRKPKFLTLGTPDRPARLFLKEPGLNGFIKIEAKENGVWGNEIGVTVREVKPAIYEVGIIFRGARFEQARAIVQGVTTETIQEVIKPGPTGVLQAKAAGVRAGITRERAEYPTS
jgi:hypothetical protein